MSQYRIYTYTSLHQILQTFTVGLLKYLKLCFSWMASNKNAIVEESYCTLILCCFFICTIKQKLVTNNKKSFWILIFDIVDVQITNLLHFSFSCSGRLGKKHQKIKQTTTQLYCKISSNAVFQLYSFDSGWSLVVLGKYSLSVGVGEKEGRYDQILPNFFSKYNLAFLSYHKINLHLINLWTVFFFSVAWNMNLPQTVSNTIIGI